MLTVLYIVVSVLVGAVAALKLIAPVTATSTDDKVLALLEKVPVEKVLELLAKKGVKV